MTTIRTHNRRKARAARNAATRRKRALKAIRWGQFYGMGVRKLKDAYADLGMSAQDAARDIGRFRDAYTLFGGSLVQSLVLGTNFAEQEARALAWHRQMLDEARARGDTVIEHTYADAIIIVKGEEE